MKEWENDEQLFGLIRAELYSSVIGDIMDKMNHLHQFLPPRIQPLREDMFIAGRAFPVLEADTFGDLIPGTSNSLMNKPFGLMLEALDDLKENEVYICTGASPNYALWGELMSTRAIKLKSAGAVVNGYSRDTNGILKLNFPTFSYGRYGQDQAPRGKVIDYRLPVEIGSVKIDPGDIVVGDVDGVCIVPYEIENQVIQRSLEKARGEKTVQKAIQNGMTAREAFERYGIM